MSGAPSHKIKDEPQSGDGCEAGTKAGLAHFVLNARTELLQWN